MSRSGQNEDDDGNENHQQVAQSEVSTTEQSQESNQQANGSYRMSKWSMIQAFLFRMLITYFVFNLFRGKTPAVNKSNKPGKPFVGPATNLLDRGEKLDLYVYLSEKRTFNEFNDTTALFWYQPNIIYGDWTGGLNKDGSFEQERTLKASKSLMNNGSMYIHMYMVKAGNSPNPMSAEGVYSKKYTIYKTKKITRHKRRRLQRASNLLTGETATPAELVHNATLHGQDASYLPAVTHWHPNFTINLIDDHTPWTQGSIPSPLDEYVEFYPPTNQYYPIVYMNDYWNLHEEYKPVNETTPELQLRVTFSPMSLFKWQLYAAQSKDNKWFTKLAHATGINKLEQDEDGLDIQSFQDEMEQDTMKRMILDTNPYLLVLTAAVSIAHAVFEILAFKNDIQFWRTRESLAGLSIRSIFFNVFQSVILLLYVWDSDTNFVIKMSAAVGMAIELWKVFKVLNVTVDWQDRVWLGLPRLRCAYQPSYVESDTKKYDQMAFGYLSWLLFPLLSGYCVYSLIYQEHRGWYSWVLSMLYGFLLTFGFITMTPQLFINYKMKSVAHLPWRMLTYKALNTFIDDLFAFIMKAPTLYRIGCLRDDVIFFIYLYQRWIYPIDPTRVNEYGLSKKMVDEHAAAVSSSGEAAPRLIADAEPVAAEGASDGLRQRKGVQKD